MIRIFKKKSIGICVCFIVVYFILYFIYYLYLPTNKNFSEKIFVIKKGENVFQISENLKKQELIKNEFIFISYVILFGKYNRIQAGYYFLNQSMNVPKIIEKFVSGETAKIKITIPEGFTTKQIDELLTLKFSQPGRVSLVKFLLNSKAKSQNAKLQFKIQNYKIIDFKEKFEFLKSVPDEINLEGFLFPDTYEFFYGISEKEIVKKMLDNFNKKFTKELREEIKNQNKTIFEILIMASLLEKEVKTFEDKKMASGILWKRLKAGMPLQVDATIVCITGKRTSKISIEETKIDSPYNTYKYKGLPLGPICNPGVESILAAIEPEDSGYWYYLSRSVERTEETIFSKTLEEHNKVKYLDR
jgi:UPF0755 protein